MAARAASAPVQAQATWHTIWQSKFILTLSVKYQCWSGGDGTKMTAELIDIHDLNRTVKKGSGYCNGAWHAFEARDVTTGTRYKIVTQQTRGRTHTEQVGVYEHY